MIQQGITILYVTDQDASRLFYQAVLETEPRLDVPGMTEFDLGNGMILGLMPVTGIRQLLGEALIPVENNPAPKAEVYLRVEDAVSYLNRAVENGARLILAVAARDWGDRVGYCLDQDGHVLAFAETQSK